MKTSLKALVLLLSLAWPAGMRADDCVLAPDSWGRMQHAWSLSWQYPASFQLLADAQSASQAMGISPSVYEPLTHQRNELLLAWALALLAVCLAIFSLPTLRRRGYGGALAAGLLALVSLGLQMHGDRDWRVMGHTAALRTQPSGSVAEAGQVPLGALGTCVGTMELPGFCFWQGLDGVQGWVETGSVVHLTRHCMRHD